MSDAGVRRGCSGTIRADPCLDLWGSCKPNFGGPDKAQRTDKFFSAVEDALKRPKLTDHKLMAEPSIHATIGEILDHHLALAWLAADDGDVMPWWRKKTLYLAFSVVRRLFKPVAEDDSARKAAYLEMRSMTEDDLEREAALAEGEQADPDYLARLTEAMARAVLPKDDVSDRQKDRR